MTSLAKNKLTVPQMGLWFEWKIDPNSNAYNNVFLFQFKHPLDNQLLNEGLVYLHRCYPILNSRLIEIDFNIYIDDQFISPEIVYFDTLEDMRENITKPFDLNRSYLFRYYLCITSNESFFGICWHHLIVDGHSSKILIDTLSAYYNKAISSTSDNNFNKYSQSDLNHIDDMLRANLPAASTYWQKIIANVSTTELFDNGNSFTENNSGKRLYFSLNRRLTEEIMQLIGVFKTTVFVFITSCIFLILKDYLNDDAMMIGYTENTRTKNIQDQVGFFVSNLPLIVNTNKNLNMLISDIQSILKNNRIYNFMPLSEIIKLYRKHNKNYVKRLFNVSINYGIYSLFNLSFREDPSIPILYDKFDCNNDLIIRFEFDRHMCFEIDYNNHIFSDIFIDAFRLKIEYFLLSLIENKHNI